LSSGGYGLTPTESGWALIIDTAKCTLDELGAKSKEIATELSARCCEIVQGIEVEM